VRNLVLVAAAALAMVPATLHAAEGTGGIRGSVSDRDVAAPLSGVRVTVVGTTLSTLTDTDGHYVLERVPAGEHTLIFSKDGYEREVANVLVTPDRLAQTDVQLNAEIIEMEELVVTGADLLADSELGLLEIPRAAERSEAALTRSRGAPPYAGSEAVRRSRASASANP